MKRCRFVAYLFIVALIAVYSSGCATVSSVPAHKPVPVPAHKPVPVPAHKPVPVPVPVFKPVPKPDPEPPKPALAIKSGKTKFNKLLRNEPHDVRIVPAIKSEKTQFNKPVSVQSEDITGSKINFETYSVRLSATERLTIPGPPGELKVWIGATSHLPQNDADVVSNEVSKTVEIEAAGSTAKISPIEGGIPVDRKESICGKISPYGSEFVFRLLPNSKGEFKVGVTIELYESSDCTGTPVPKSAKSVSVQVHVDYLRLAQEMLSSLVTRTWKLFLEFWDKLVFLVFSLVLFLIRGKLRKLFGFSGDDKSNE